MVLGTISNTRAYQRVEIKTDPKMDAGSLSRKALTMAIESASIGLWKGAQKLYRAL
jgi:hypothetical protein